MKRARSFGVLRGADGCETPVRSRTIANTLAALQAENQQLRAQLSTLAASRREAWERDKALRASWWHRLGVLLRAVAR